MTGNEFWHKLIDLKCHNKWWKEAYAVTTIDTPAVRWWAGLADHYTIPAGTRVKVVMVSRFGDVGITDDMSDAYFVGGYTARIPLHPDSMGYSEVPPLKDFEIVT